MKYLYKCLSVCTLFFVSFISSYGQVRNSSYEAYIEKYKDLAIEAMERYDIPASITLAQGIYESGAGRSELAVKANNHFGIKCGSDWIGGTSYHDDDAKGECFRKYKSVEQSYADHSLFLRKNRYSRLFQLDITDYKGWARGLKACGYATSPTYASRLIDLIELYELYRFDDKSYRKKKSKKDTVEGDFSYENISISRVYRENNSSVCVVSREGDTWQSLSKELHVSVKRLLKYNDAEEWFSIYPNTYIYLEKKENKAEKKYKKHWHTIKSGESMYSICQLYGIRLESLYKINFLSPDYIAREGDLLKVR